MAKHEVVGAKSEKSKVSGLDVQGALKASLMTGIMAVAFSGSACRATRMDSGSDLAGRQVSLPEKLETKESWDILSAEVHHEILDSEYRSYPSLKMTDLKNPDALTNPAEKALADKMKAYLKATADLRIEDSVHAQIGLMQVVARNLLLHSDTVLGGEIRYIQQGCVMADQTAPHFVNEAAAKKAGCDLNDQTVWVAMGQFNHDGTPIAVSDVIEWIGN